MTALKGKAGEAFADRRDKAMAAILLYGPDQGLVRERAEKIARQICKDFRDPFNYLDLAEADLKGDPARLADEAVQLSLMGGERVIRVRTSGEAAAPAAKLLVEGIESGRLKPNGAVLIEAGDLGKTSGLRKLFESAKKAVAIPCYADAPADTIALAEAAARAEGLAIEKAAADLLATLLGEDRGLTRQEIDKLILYKGPKAARTGPPDARSATITLDDVRAMLVDTITDAAGEVAGAAADGAPARLARALYRSSAAGASPVGTVRVLQRDFARLRAARAMMAEGLSAENAMARLRPPVFYMEQRAFAARLTRWTAPRIDAALDLLLEAELGAKSTGLPDEAIVERAAFKIAAMAGR